MKRQPLPPVEELERAVATLQDWLKGPKAAVRWAEAQEEITRFRRNAAQLNEQLGVAAQMLTARYPNRSAAIEIDDRYTLYYGTWGERGLYVIDGSSRLVLSVTSGSLAQRQQIAALLPDLLDQLSYDDERE